MFCSISGQPPEEPVVSTKSGHLYDKRLIAKETGECPVTRQPLSLDDLLPLKTNKVVKPRTGATTSIPGLLSIFHNEWDALMLETHQLKEALEARNKELATALYQYDAAARVIARLTAERDEARAALASGAGAAGLKRGAEGMEVDGAGAAGVPKKAKGGITADVVHAMTETAQTLAKGRKKRPPPPGLAAPEALAGYSLAETVPLHKSASPGVFAIAVHAAHAGGLVATAGGDKTVVVYDKGAGKKVATVSGHGKRVTDVKWAGTDGGALLTASADKTVRLWRPAGGDGGFAAAATMADHADEVVAVTVHACGAYAVSLSADSSWCFYDLPSATCLTQVADAGVKGGYTCGAFHPDGLILGTGSADAVVRIWDAKSAANVAKFEGHAGAMSALAFSENGYYLATAAADSVKLWDLRKLKNFHTLAPASAGDAPAALDFDYSGAYLAVGGAEGVRVFGVKKEFELLKQFDALGPKKPVSALRFGPDAAFLLAGSGADHNLRIFQ